MLHFFVFLCVLTSIIAGQEISRTTGSIEFNFDRLQCNKNTFHDTNRSSILGLLLRNQSSSDCIRGNGVRALPALHLTVPLVTSSTITPLIPAIMDSQAMTLEFWLDTNSTGNADAYLFSVTESKPTGICKSNLQIYRVANNSAVNPSHIMLQTCSSNGDILTLNLGTIIPAPTPTHLSITLSYATANYYSLTFYTITAGMYINGQFSSSATNASPSPLLAWNPSYRMYLLNNPAVASSSYTNNLYLFAWHTKALNISGIVSNYLHGRPNSLPVVWNTTITIHEDGEMSPNSKPPLFYRHPLPLADIAYVTLPVFDIDGTNPIPILMSLPARGILYSDGQQAVVGDKLGAVQYQPYYNQHSTSILSIYDSFTITAIDIVSNLAADSTATVSVIVAPVNDPPVPTPGSAAILANKYQLLVLPGYDIDSSSNFSARIISQPMNGKLYHVVSGIAGSIITNNTLLNSNIVVFYYTGPQICDAAGIVGRDILEYSLIDDMGAESVSEAFHINISTSLRVVNTTAIATEDTRSCFNISGIDDSHSLPMWVQIMSLPLFGLLTYSNGTLLHINDTLPTILTNISSATVCYHTTFYFNLPKVSNPAVAEHFRYRIVGAAGQSSKEGVQKIEVINKNDATEVRFTGPEIIRASTYATSISGFNISDVDLNTDVILARISCISGLLKLNLAYIDALDFNSFQYCFTKCIGDGYDDHAMAFVGTPEDIQLALNGLTYTSVMSHVDDTITLSLHDGVGGECLSSTAFTGSVTVRNECYSRNVSIQVEVRVGLSENSFDANSTSIMDLSLRMKAIVFGSFLCLIIIIWRSCVSCGRCRMKAREALEKEIDLRTQEIISRHIMTEESV